MKLPGPDHPITITPFAGRVRVRMGAQAIADTSHALSLAEASWPAVLYLPRADVHMSAFTRSSHRTYCPYKGDASYFDVGDVKNAAWSYETPYPAMAAIGSYLAFYPDKVTIERLPPG